jgi:hypothetical protein
MNPKLNNLKKEVQSLPQPEVVRLLLRLARLKAENKEMLHYMLYYESDSLAYAETMKPEILLPFSEPFVNTWQMAKKLRKSLRLIAKYTRFTSNRAGESELLLSMVEQYLEQYRFEFRQSALAKIMVRCLKRIHDNFDRIHEDFRADYEGRFEDALRLLKTRLGSEFSSELKSRIS